MTAETLAILAGAALSLLFEYVPGFNTWFDSLPEVNKRLGMAALMFLVALGVFGLNCSGLVLEGVPAVSCDVAGGWGLLVTWVIALGANQLTHKAFKRPEAA